MSSHRRRDSIAAVSRRETNDSLYQLRESVRRTSLSYLLTEAAPPESSDATLSDVELDSLGSDLEKMYASSFQKLASLAPSFRAVSASMPKTTELLKIASKNLSSKMADTENPESAALFAAAETFMSSFASLMVTTRRATKSMKGDDGEALEDTTTLEAAYGEDGLKKLISTKFIPSVGFSERMAGKMKPFSDYFKDIADTGRAMESFERYDERLLEIDLFEFNEFDSLNEGALHEAGFFQSLKSLFSGGIFTFKSFLQGLFGKDVKDAKSAVKSMLPLFGGKNIAAALLEDLRLLKIADVKTFLDKNAAFYRGAVSGGGSGGPAAGQRPSSPGGGEAPVGRGAEGGDTVGSGAREPGGSPGGGGESGTSRAPPLPSPEQTQAIRSAPDEVKNDSRGALEKIFSPEVAAKFMDVAGGKTKVDSLESPEKEIISAFIANISKSVSRGEALDATAAATAAKKKITGIDDVKKGAITALGVTDEGFESLTDKLLSADPAVRAELGLSVESRRRTTLEGAISKKSMAFLLETEAPATSAAAKEVIKSAIEKHLSNGATDAVGVASKVYDILVKKDAPAAGTSEAPAAEAESATPPAVTEPASSTESPVSGGERSEEKKYAAGDVVEIEGEKKISLGLTMTNLDPEERKGVLDKVKSSLGDKGKLRLKAAGYPGAEDDQKRNEISIAINKSAKENLKIASGKRKELATKLIETRESSDSLIIERWQRLAGLIK